jgi:hypothetical protein
MSLSWEGTIYKVDAVSKTNTTAPLPDDDCKPADARRRANPSRKISPNKAAAKPAPQKAKKADAAEPEYYRREDPSGYDSGPSYHHHEEPSTPTTY